MILGQCRNEHHTIGEFALSRLRIAAIAAATGAAIVATIASGSSNEATRVDGDGAAAQASEFNVGDMVELGDWRVQVHNVADPYTPSNDFITPAAGNRFVVVDAEVTNNSDSSQTVSSIICFELRDSTNRSYNVTFVGDNSSTIDGDAAPGSARRGDLAFELPGDAVGLQLQFKCDLFSSGSAVINLS